MTTQRGRWMARLAMLPVLGASCSTWRNLRGGWPWWVYLIDAAVPSRLQVPPGAVAGRSQRRLGVAVNLHF